MCCRCTIDNSIRIRIINESYFWDAQVLADAAAGKPGYEKAMKAEEAPHYSDNDDR